MAKTDNLNDYLADLYLGIQSKNQNASKNPQDFRSEIENISVTDPIPEWDPTNFTREGEPIKPTPYKLSGKWLLNDSVTAPSNLDTTQVVKFTSNNVEYTIFNVYVNNAGTETYIDYGKDSSNWVSVYDTSGSNYWASDTYKSINFGTTPQEVSSEFYGWFMENAVPNEIAYPARFIYGKYFLADTLGFSTIPSELHDYTHYVLCRINNATYIGFTIGNGTVAAIAQSTLETVTLYDSDGWKKTEYQNWTFPDASSLTAVSTLFYDWLVSNINHLVIVNSNDNTQRETFYAPRDYEFVEFVGSEYDTTNGAFSIADNGQVYYKGFAVYMTTYSEETGTEFAYILSTNSASGTVYYAGLISFTIDGTLYQAEKGMTWEEWVANTTYNTANASISDNFIVINGKYVSEDDGVQAVYTTTQIVSGYAYTLPEMTSG